MRSEMSDAPSNCSRALSKPPRTLPRSSSAPIFLTGFPRSGTTWINSLLQEYFDCGMVNEGQFIVTFGKRIKRYGSLESESNRWKLLHDLRRDEFFSILKRNYDVEIEWGRIAEEGASFSAIVEGVLKQIAEQTGKRRIGSKNPAFGYCLDLVNRLFPGCRVVHVVRDGRDCALSHRRVRWGFQNAFSTATNWRNYLKIIGQSSTQMSGRYFEFRYEDLLLNPESTMSRLEHFITDCPGNPVATRFLQDQRSLRADRVAQWRQEMPERSQAIFESVAGDMLQRYGYPLMGVNQAPSLLFKAGCVVHDRVSRETSYWGRRIFKSISEYK